MLTDGRTTDAGVTCILIAHLGAFGSGELKIIYWQDFKGLIQTTDENSGPMVFQLTRVDHTYI